MAEVNLVSKLSYLITDQKKSKHSRFIPVQITDLRNNSNSTVSSVKQSRKFRGEMPHIRPCTPHENIPEIHINIWKCGLSSQMPS